MIHYHGGPITPETCALRAWRGRHAFVSFEEPRQIALAASVCQSFALDNGAFTAWRNAGQPRADWTPYYEWAEEWLNHPSCDWAVIPDVIGGSEEENDALLAEWPFGHRGVPVWHLNESLERLERIASTFPRVALGSAMEYDVSRPARCIERLGKALTRISDHHGRPTVKLHGLRMLRPELVTAIPLSSADSSNIARNHSNPKVWNTAMKPSTAEARVDVMIDRIESHQSPDRFTPGDEQLDLFG